MKTFIYSLSHPETGEVKYIGKANNPKTRYREHLFDKKKTRKVNWIRSLKKVGLIPELIIVDAVSSFDWDFWEKHYISLYRSWGFNLTNHTDGGGGCSSRTISDETRFKMRMAQLGKKHLPETKAKISAIHLGVKLSEEHKQKLSLSSKGRIRTKEHSAKIGAKHKGKVLSEETKELIRQKLKGRKQDPLIAKKRALTKSKPLLQFDKDWNFLREFASSKDANLFYNKNSHNLSDYFKGKKKTWLGFNWKYKE
ncbi:MAG: GIY-YIG nuclease family protein [Flavobacterium sp.]